MSPQDTRNESGAVCPNCEYQTVLIETAPRRPPRLRCAYCEWTSFGTEVAVRGE